MKRFPMNIKIFYPKNPRMCDPEILVTLLKMQPHYSQSSREIATPTSGTPPVISYKEVPPAPYSGLYTERLRSERHNIVFESRRVARTGVGVFDWLVSYTVCD